MQSIREFFYDPTIILFPARWTIPVKRFFLRFAPITIPLWLVGVIVTMICMAFCVALFGLCYETYVFTTSRFKSIRTWLYHFWNETPEEYAQRCFDEYTCGFFSNKNK